jgi:hypothetical protein
LEADLGHAGVEAGAHHDVGPTAVGGHEHVGAGDGVVDVALGGEVDHGVDPTQGVTKGQGVADVAVDEGHPGIGLEIGDGRPVAGVSEGVVDDHAVVGGREQVPDVVGPDEPSPTGDENPHLTTVVEGA